MVEEEEDVEVAVEHCGVCYSDLSIINNEDNLVAIAVQKELTYIEEAVKLVVSGLRAGGRLIYAGAGTSGRLGVLDAVECEGMTGVGAALKAGDSIVGGCQYVHDFTFTFIAPLEAY